MRIVDPCPPLGLPRAASLIKAHAYDEVASERGPCERRLGEFGGHRNPRRTQVPGKGEAPRLIARRGLGPGDPIPSAPTPQRHVADAPILLFREVSAGVDARWPVLIHSR